MYGEIKNHSADFHIDKWSCCLDWLFSKSLLRVCKNILCAMKVKASVFMKQQNNL